MNLRNTPFDELYENVNDDETLNITDFQSKLNDLLELEFIFIVFISFE